MKSADSVDFLIPRLKHRDLKSADLSLCRDQAPLTSTNKCLSQRLYLPPFPLVAVTLVVNFTAVESRA